MKKKIRVLVADDHTIVRKGLCALLEGDKEIEVVGDAENGTTLPGTNCIGPMTPILIVFAPQAGKLTVAIKIDTRIVSQISLKFFMTALLE